MSSCSACNKRYLGKCSTPFEYKHLAHVWCENYANYMFGKCKLTCANNDKHICCYECKDESTCKVKSKCDKTEDFKDNNYINCQNYIKAE